jgi:hypothetical protein
MSHLASKTATSISNNNASTQPVDETATRRKLEVELILREKEKKELGKKILEMEDRMRDMTLVT